MLASVRRLSELLGPELLRPEQLRNTVGAIAAGTRAVVKLVGLPPDAHTALRGRAGPHKQLVWSEPIDLAVLRGAAHAAGATVNDLLLSSLSGALRAQLARTDGYARDVRAIVPYNIRPLAQPLPPELGNRFGLVFLSLPVSVDDPIERLAEQRRRMNGIKRSAEGVVSFQILDLVGYTPNAVEQVIVDVFASKGTAVVTNVAGPRQPVFLAGREVRGTIGWPPESGNIGLGRLDHQLQRHGDARADGRPRSLVPEPGRLLEHAAPRAGHAGPSVRPA